MVVYHNGQNTHLVPEHVDMDHKNEPGNAIVLNLHTVEKTAMEN